MTFNADALRHLHRIHRQLADLRGQLDRGPKQIKIRETSVAKLEVELSATREKTTAARMAADHKQLQLKTGEAKIVDLRNKLNTCNTNREYQALLEQIAADEMTNSVLEDEILEALEKIEQLQVNIGEAEQHVAKGSGELEKVRTEVAESAARVNGEISRLEAELLEAEQNIPSDFRADYERVVRGKGQDAMAEVDGDCCSGCYQYLTPNMLNQVQMSQIVACKSCGRFLYRPEDRSIGS